MNCSEFPNSSAQPLRNFSNQANIFFGINLSDIGMFVTKRDLGGIKAELFSRSSRERVPKLIWCPWLYANLFAGSFDSFLIARHLINITRRSCRVLFFAVDLRRLNFCLSR